MAKAPIFSSSKPGGVLSLLNREIYYNKVFFVDASATLASDAAGFGESPETPFATLDYAFASCTADKGDIIFVAAAHTETVSGSIAADVAGVEVRGVMAGTLKPTITFDNTAGEINVTAANVKIMNLRLVSGVDSLVNFFDVDESFCHIEDVDMVTGSATEAVGFINLATTHDNLTVRGCTALQPTDPEGTDNAAGTGFLYLVDSLNILLEDNIILGQFETAIIHNLTTKCGNLFSRRNIYRQEHSAALIFDLVTASTGHSRDDTGHTPAATDATPALCIGSYDIEFWISRSSDFSNDSAGGGQGMIASETATT